MITLQEFTNKYQDLNTRLSKSGLLLLHYFVTNPINLNKNQKEIAIDLGKCRATINRSIAVLIEVGYIEYNNKYSCKKYINKNVTPIIEDALTLEDIQYERLPEANIENYKQIIKHYKNHVGKSFNSAVIGNYLVNYPDHYNAVHKYLYDLGKTNIITGKADIWMYFNVYYTPEKFAKIINENIKDNCSLLIPLE